MRDASTGQWLVEPAELHRVYPPIKDTGASNGASAMNAPLRTDAVEAENRELGRGSAMRTQRSMIFAVALMTRQPSAAALPRCSLISERRNPRRLRHRNPHRCADGGIGGGNEAWLHHTRRLPPAGAAFRDARG